MVRVKHIGNSKRRSAPHLPPLPRSANCNRNGENSSRSIQTSAFCSTAKGGSRWKCRSLPSRWAPSVDACGPIPSKGLPCCGSCPAIRPWSQVSDTDRLAGSGICTRCTEASSSTGHRSSGCSRCRGTFLGSTSKLCQMLASVLYFLYEVKSVRQTTRHQLQHRLTLVEGRYDQGLSSSDRHDHRDRGGKAFCAS